MIANLSQRLVVLFAFGVAPVGVLAPKGTVALLVITGLGGLVRWAADEYPRQPFLNAFLASLVALVLWAGASAAWAISPDTILGLVLRLTML